MAKEAYSDGKRGLFTCAYLRSVPSGKRMRERGMSFDTYIYSAGIAGISIYSAGIAGKEDEGERHVV